MKDINQVYSTVKSFWGEKKYEKWTSVGLLSEYFKTQFNPSATHHQIYQILDGSRKLNLNDKPEKRFVIEKVFRVSDIDKVGDHSHLSFFEMLGVVKFITPQNSIPFEERLIFLKDVFEFLEKLNILKDRIYCTYHKDDKTTLDALKVLGVNEEQCLPTKGLTNFLHPTNANDLAGPRVDLYVQLSKESFLEIATTDFSYLITTQDGELKINKNFSMMGFYTGIERLTMIVCSKQDVWNISPFSEGLDTINREILNITSKSKFKHLLIPEKRQLIDYARSILFIVSEGQRVDSSSRGRILRNLIKGLLRNFLNLAGSFEPDIMFKIFQVIKEKYQNRYQLHPEDALNVITEYLEKERKMQRMG